MISAQIIEDSISSDSKSRITTLFLEYPRFIHAEVMTHRLFSRNASSSRAIPVKKILEMVKNNPAMPEWWGKNQPGMQAEEQLAEDDVAKAKDLWLLSRDVMLQMAESLNDLGLHKQIANRVLEPWMHMGTLVTATEFQNFFNQRIHHAAQPEMKELAIKVRSAIEDSRPTVLSPGDWHLPYIRPYERGGLTLAQALKVSTARCARTSYLNPGGVVDSVEKDCARHDSLLGNGHMSPFEHAAVAVADSSAQHGNFTGWKQYRKFIPGEACFVDSPEASERRLNGIELV